MNKSIRKLVSMLALLLVSLGSAQVATAEITHLAAAQSSASNYVGNQPGVSKSQAAAAARSEVGGRVISVKPRKGSQGYRVRMLVEGGRVVTVNVDGKGRVKK